MSRVTMSPGEKNRKYGGGFNTSLPGIPFNMTRLFPLPFRTENSEPNLTAPYLSKYFGCANVLRQQVYEQSPVHQL